MPSPQEISPAEARERLEQGNRRAVAGEARKRDLPARVAALRDGQRPLAAVLGCMDSRVAPELVFDQDLGDLMSVRVAGNVVGDHVLASLEFAGQVVGVSLVVVLGHTDDERVVTLAEPLRREKIKVGDHLLVDPRTQYALEKMPKSAVEEVVLEEVVAHGQADGDDGVGLAA